MNDAVHREDPFHVEATSSLADDRTRVLKHDDSFAVFDRHGDIGVVAPSHQGIFFEGTRHLSHLSFVLAGHRPLLLSSTVKKDNLLLAVDLTNADFGDATLPQGVLHVFRGKFLWQGSCYEHIKISNYSLEPLRAEFSLRFSADYIDVFELRGMVRAARGESMPPQISDSAVELRYRGRDGVTRHTHIGFSPTPTELAGSEAKYRLDIPSKGEVHVFVHVQCYVQANKPPFLDYDTALQQAMNSVHRARAKGCGLTTSNVQFNSWLDRSLVDLHMMTTQTPHGPYPYAGVPWYSTVFGRDGMLTALQYLWLDPSLTRGVLLYLAAQQAHSSDAARDAEPGKILHETRKGEMAALGEIPFSCYYGSVDSTPLFVMLAGYYFERTGDLALIETIWPNIERALAWIERHGDTDGDGFVEYARHSDDGLLNQGWKDSHDAMFDAAGSLAQGSIALCEVQGYVFSAKQRAAAMARALNKESLARDLERQAQDLQQRFDTAFWCEDIGTYAMALDGNKTPLRVRSSNAGHTLFTGIALPARAARLAHTLLQDDSFSGWGIRTIAASARGFNPMSYHNGSVWPHDTALIAWGLSQYGYQAEALTILGGIFEASRYMELNRLPELFCGFVQREDEAPTLYPVACMPQAWASGAAFMLMQGCLGMTIRALPQPHICLSRPVLPDFLQEVRIENLEIGAASIDLVVRRYRDDVGVHVLRRSGEPVEIVVVK